MPEYTYIKGTRMYELERLRNLNLTYEEAIKKFDLDNKAWMELSSAEQELLNELLKEKINKNK